MRPAWQIRFPHLDITIHDGSEVAAVEVVTVLLVAEQHDTEALDGLELDPSERDAIIPKINATVPAFAYANYQSKSTRIIPIFELHKDES